MLNSIFLIALISIILLTLFSYIPDSESLILQFQDYQIETSLLFLAVTFLIAFFAISFAIYFFLKIGFGIKVRQINSLKNKHEKTLDMMAHLLPSIYLGDAKNSKKILKKLKKPLQDQDYLYQFLEAKYHASQKDSKSLIKNLKSLYASNPNDPFVLNSLGAEYFKEKEYEKATKYLEKAHKSYSKSENTIELLIRNYQKTANFSELEKLFKNAIRSKTISKNNYQKEIAINHLEIALKSKQEEEFSKYYEYSKLAFKTFKEHPQIIFNYAKSLIHQDKSSACLKHIKTYWNRYAHPELTEILINLLDKQSDKNQIKSAENLIELNPYSIESYIIFASLAKNKNEYHDHAINYLEKALNIQKSKITYELLLEIKSNYLSDTSDEVMELRNKLHNFNNEPGYYCQKCNLHNQKWHSICSECNSYNSLEYKYSAPRNLLS